MTWREHCAPIIARVLRETAGADEKAIRRALRDAYPYGQREMHPYKTWCDEIRRQRGLKPKLGAHVSAPDPRQLDLPASIDAARARKNGDKP